MSDITTGNFVCIEQTPANVGDRIVGRIIDLVLISVYLYAAGSFLRHTPGFSDDVMQGIYVFLVFLPALAYTFLSELLFDGQTVGKAAWDWCSYSPHAATNGLATLLLALW